ncbi:tape measure protein [Bosea sp. FBZP-16]|uniref:tape measure protein n=1 Tax=Bosea sp. FBZP-16 TaxID=2065382 RepID=UPI000C308440|nr:tape measure protein [Bosea sp. FBZP-16]
MATDIETLSLLLEVQGQKFENQLKRQNAQAYRIFKSLEDRASEMESNVSGSFDKLARIVGGAAVLNELKKLADTWQEATNKIKSAGVGEAMAGAVSNEIADIASRSRTGFAEVADLYARLTRTGKDFGATQGEIALATETVSKALKVSGASASETQATLVQLGQALGSGRLQGDELRSLLENAPVVAQAIAKEFGVAVGQLKDLGAEGKLVSDRVFRAIVNAAPEVSAAFAKTNASIADSFTILQNAALKFVGNSQQMGIAAAAASSSIQFLAKNIDGVATAAAAVGAVIASRLVAQGLAPMVAQIGATVTASAAASAGLTALGVRAQLAATSVAALRGALALVGGPVGAAILGTAAVVAYLATEAGKGKESTDRYAEALKALRPPADDAKSAIKGVGDQVAETSDRMDRAVTDGYNRKLKEDAAAARDLETTIRSATQGLEQYGSAGLKAEDKKRGLDLVKQGMEGNAQQAIAAADELRKLGETNISFASAFGSIAAMLTQLAAVRQAAVATRAALANVEAGQAGEANAKKSRDEQAALVKSGFVPVGPAFDAQSDPVLAGLRLQREVRLAQMDKDKKALQDKTKELYDAALGQGGGVTLKQAEAAAKQILAAEAAQKGGGGGKGPKSDEDKAEDRINKYIDSLARQNLVLQAEIDNFGKSNAQKRAAVELAKAGVDLNRLDAETREEVLAKLNKEITLSEQLRTKKKELEDAQKSYNDASKFFGDAATDALEDLIINGAKAEDVMKRLVATLAKAALQAALMGSGPLAGIFGTSGTNGGVGGLFGLLFGGIGGKADGGWISGPGTGKSDSILSWLSDGEHVTNARSAKKYAPLLNAINNDRMPKFATGGFVGAMSTPSVPSGISTASPGPAKITINNTQSDNVQADAKQDSNGDISIMISAIGAKMADDILRGRGPMSAALSARQTNRHLR